VFARVPQGEIEEIWVGVSVVDEDRSVGERIVALSHPVDDRREWQVTTEEGVAQKNRSAIGRSRRRWERSDLPNRERNP